jgi:hypothetical protein
MVKIEIDEKLILFPENWDELTEEDFRRVCHVLLNPWSAALQYTIIRLLTPTVHPSTWVNLSDDNLIALLPLTEFLKTPVKLKSMKLFSIGLRGFYLPNRDNLLTADWAFSEKLIKAFLTTGKEEYLNQLVAFVCRPEKLWIQFFPFLKSLNLNWNGDYREKFHSSLAMERAKKISKIPMHKKLMVVWWIIQIRWEVQRQNQGLFNGSGKSAGDWIEAAMEISEKGLFGNFEQTMQTPFNLVLKYLNHQKNKQ